MIETLQSGTHLRGAEHTYELQQELGRGGFGVTYLAQREDGLLVALKALLINQLDQWKTLELFEREIAVLRSLDHPRVPDYVDHFHLGDDPRVPDGFALVQQFVDGFGLDAVVRGEHLLDPGQMVSWLAQILDVLAYLHQLSPPVIHRDVTPKNILLQDDGAAYLVDFGTVQAAARLASDTSLTSAGTFGYAPMEQFIGSAAPGSDLYGLGMTFLAVAAGHEPSEMPFVGTRVDVQTTARLDARVALILERMTEPDPRQRMGDARIALRQLRPLQQRYAPRNSGIEAASLQQAAALIHAEQLPSSRPRVAADDLLPSERMREAQQRLDGVDTPMVIPALDELVGWLGSGAIAASGEVVCLDQHILDTSTMNRVAKLRRNARVVACNATGDTLVAIPEDASNLFVFNRDGTGYHEGPELPLVPGEGLVISPDGRSLAWPSGSAVELYDLRNGTLSQRIEGRFNSVWYSADGRTLAALAQDRRLRLMHADGTEVLLQDISGIAFASDGRNAALFSYDRLLIGPLDQLRRGEAPLVIAADNNTWKCPCFSPDGKWLALLDYSNDKLLVFDVRTGRQTHCLTDPTQPTGRLPRVYSLGFTANSDRLMVLCDVHYNRFSNKECKCLALWAMPSGRFLGAMLRSSRNRSTLLTVCAEGFYGRQNPKSRKPSSAKSSGWERPELAQRALCGEPVDQQLDDADRAALADLEERWAYFSDLRAKKQLDAEADLGALVEASSGLTHLLDLVVRNARQAQTDGPAFGAGAAERPCNGDHLLTAARELTGRPAEQKKQLFDELLQQAEQIELARAQQEEQQPAAPDPGETPRTVACEASGVTPQSAAFWGTADRRTRRFVVAAGGITTFIVAIAACLAVAIATFAVGGPGLAHFGYLAIYGVMFALLLLLLVTFTIEVDRNRRTLCIFRSPVPFMSYTCPLSDARAEPGTTQMPGMGRLGRDFRIYLRGGNGVDHLLFKGRKRTTRADRILAKLEQLLHPPTLEHHAAHQHGDEAHPGEHDRGDED